MLFCHASPRSDEEIVTPLSPEARIAPMLAGVAQRTVVLGHTHVQFDREVAGRRLVNAGSVGMPYEGRAAAFWALLGPGVELRRTRYDVTVTCARVRESGIPEAEEYAEGSRARRAPPRRTSSSSAWPRAVAPESASGRACVPRPAMLRQTPYSAASQVSRCRLTSARNCAA